jgi:hypothetical protein
MLAAGAIWAVLTFIALAVIAMTVLYVSLRRETRRRGREEHYYSPDEYHERQQQDS